MNEIKFPRHTQPCMHTHIHSHLIRLYFNRQATLHSIVSVFNFKTVPTNSCEQTRLSKCVCCVPECVCVSCELRGLGLSVHSADKSQTLYSTVTQETPSSVNTHTQTHTLRWQTVWLVQSLVCGLSKKTTMIFHPKNSWHFSQANHRVKAIFKTS